MYQILNEGDSATILLSGEVDLQTTAELKAEIAALSGIAALNINAESVSYIDSSGIAILLIARQHCLATNIIFTMSVISQPVFRVLQLAKLHEFLPIEAVSENPSTGADNYGFESVPPSNSANGLASGEQNRVAKNINPGDTDSAADGFNSESFNSGSFNSAGFKLGDFR